MLLCLRFVPSSPNAGWGKEVPLTNAGNKSCFVCSKCGSWTFLPTTNRESEWCWDVLPFLLIVAAERQNPMLLDGHSPGAGMEELCPSWGRQCSRWVPHLWRWAVLLQEKPTPELALKFHLFFEKKLRLGILGRALVIYNTEWHFEKDNVGNELFADPNQQLDILTFHGFNLCRGVS